MKYLSLVLVFLMACSGASVQQEHIEQHKTRLAVADSGIHAYALKGLKNPDTYQDGGIQYAHLKKDTRILLVNDLKERGTSVTTYNRLRRKEKYEYLHNSDVIELPMAVYEELESRGNFEKKEYRKVYLYGRHFKGKRFTSLRSLHDDINMVGDLKPLTTDLIALHAFVARDSAGAVTQYYTAFSLNPDGGILEAVPLTLTADKPVLAEYLKDRAQVLEK